MMGNRNVLIQVKQNTYYNTNTNTQISNTNLILSVKNNGQRNPDRNSCLLFKIPTVPFSKLNFRFFKKVINFEKY